MYRTIAVHNGDRKVRESKRISRGKDGVVLVARDYWAGYICICFTVGRAYGPVCARAQVHARKGHSRQTQ